MHSIRQGKEKIGIPFYQTKKMIVYIYYVAHDTGKGNGNNNNNKKGEGRKKRKQELEKSAIP
jgi:hypothetical protein